MKNRTIEELNDLFIGHQKFAGIVNMLILDGHTITDIKEFNEKFKFKIDGYAMEYDKNWKSSKENYVNWVNHLLYMRDEIERMRKK